MKLYFAETSSGLASGKRVFNVNVEGTLISGIDIVQEVGLNTALIKTVPSVTVSDGVLNINFTSVQGSQRSPVINAIEVLPLP